MTNNQKHLEIQPGGAIDQTKCLYIKRPEDDILYRLLNDGNYCNILTSRQMGKSSLVVSTMNQLLNDGIQVSSVDLSADTDNVENPDDWYCAILQHIGDDLDLSIDVKDWWKNCNAITRNQKLIEFFLQNIILHIKQSLVIFLDEIDSTLNLPHTDNFFIAIRSMFNKRSMNPVFKKVVFCLIGVYTPNELIKNHQASKSPYNIGEMLELRDFDIERDDLSLLSDALAKDSTLGKQIVYSILKWTSGHPFLTSLLCKKYKDDTSSSKAEDITPLINTSFPNFEVAKRNEIHFHEVDSFLKTRTKDSLKAFRFYEKIFNEEKEDDKSTEVHQHLKLSGIVKRDQNNYLIVRNQIYKKVFNSDWIANNLRSQNILM
ncbi:MAG: hypothetical protein GY777_21960 [Candidatus Brocadiaceae bacterium]|nr:hypothetical protein [Candidatus Brocadiaceae bacterium]